MGNRRRTFGHKTFAQSYHGRAPYGKMPKEKGAAPKNTFNAVKRELTPVEEAAFKEVQALYASSGKWAHRHALVANKIIEICARHGVPVDAILSKFVRRASDIGVATAVMLQMDYLRGKTAAKKRSKR